MRGDLNGCEELNKAKAEIKEMIKIFGLPDKCPIDKVIMDEIFKQIP